jgi:GT2 family glycosyltransferase
MSRNIQSDRLTPVHPTLPMISSASSVSRNEDDRAQHLARLDASRRAILQALTQSTAGAGSFTLVRGLGNLGDQLIAAGARQLLAGLLYTEVSIEEGIRSRGETAVLMGSGAWCKAFHEIMPGTLRLLEERYARVIVLPSSFDVSVPSVRKALQRSRAIVFAREEESHRRIASLCEARLAHDTAFFFDFAPYAVAGSGVLQAYRGDAEATGRSPLPAGNRDISATLSTLDEWLWTIARHADVHTDRAHVMIAAALMNKRVTIYPSATHKVTAIAEYALGAFDVRHGMARLQVDASQAAMKIEEVDDLRSRLLQKGEESLRRIPPEWIGPAGRLRVTVVVVSWNRLERTRACIESVVRHLRIPFRLLVIDNGSEAEVRDELVRLCAQVDEAELRLLETNGGVAVARQLAGETARTEYVAFLDNDAEVFPGAIEHLLLALDQHPESLVVGGRVVLPDGLLQFCGGNGRLHDGVIRFEPKARGRAFDDPGVVPEECHWVGGTAFACRRELFDEFPIDPLMDTYFEDNEWCYRIGRRYPRAFRTVPDAVVLHHQQSKERQGSDAAEILRLAHFLPPMARFYEQHGLILDDLFGFVSELQLPDGTRDVAAARLLLELVTEKGPEWVAMQWLAGALSPLFQRRPLMALTTSRWFRLASYYWTVRVRIAAALRRLLRKGPS